MNAATTENNAFMSVKQVAEYLHLNEKKVYALVNDGSIPATKVTGKWMFPRELVDHWIAVPSAETPRIQEAHIVIIHLLCEALEGTVTGESP